MDIILHVLHVVPLNQKLSRLRQTIAFTSYSDRILMLYKCISIKGYVIEIVGINYNSIITWNTTL